MKDDYVIDFLVPNTEEIEDIEIAARAEGDITSELNSKISNRVAELLGKSQL